jgi:hypothetical protein
MVNNRDRRQITVTTHAGPGVTPDVVEPPPPDPTDDESAQARLDGKEATAMTRMVRLLVVLLLPLLVITGCKGATPNAAAPPASAANSSGAALPADPPENSTDAAPIDQSCPATNTTAFAKTKFAAHTGLAFGAFHRYLYKPYQGGTFAKGASGRITAFIKGGLAALFIKREIRLASQDVKANPSLCKAIAAPLAKIGDSVQAAYDKLKTGDPSGITATDSAVSSVETTSTHDGVPITENDNPDLTSTPS